MTPTKFITFILVLAFALSCSSTKNEEIDFTQISDTEMMQMADQKMQLGQYENAINDYKKLLRDFPTSNLHIDAQLKIAEAYGKLDKFEEQMNQLHQLVKENIIPKRVPKIYVQLGKFYERAALFNPGITTTDSMDYVDAISYYEQALKYPDSDDNRSKSEAQYRRALVTAKIGDIQKAIEDYQKVSNVFPNSDFSILAQIKLQDPTNTMELAVTDSAMTNYRQMLGLSLPEAVNEENNEAIPTEDPAAENDDNSNLDETINLIQQDTTATDTNTLMEETLTPAEDDSSDIK